MPTVRVSRTQQTDAIPGARRTAAETSTSTGAGYQRAKGQQAAALGDLGATAFQIGAQHYTRLEKEARDKANFAANLETDNFWDGVEQSEIDDPDNGALNVHGKAAFELPEKVRENIEKKAGERAKELGTDDQRLYFAQQKQRRTNGMMMRTLRHVSTEGDAYYKGELDATLTNSASNAARSAVDAVGAEGENATKFELTRIGAELTRGDKALETALPQLGIAKDDERYKAAVEQYHTEFHTGVINNLLANNAAKAAEIYFDETKGQISGKALDALTKAIKQGTLDAEGQKTAGDVWSTMGPTSDSDPISLDKMEDAVRAKYGDDTEKIKATIAALRFRIQGVETGRRERENKRNTTVWGAVINGASYDDIRSLPEFVESPDIQLKVRDYLQRQAEHVESLANTRENRALAQENRAYTAALRRDRQMEQQGWSAYWEMSDPEKLRGLTRGDIMARVVDLGPAHVQRLLSDQEQLQKGDATVRAAAIDNDLFKEVANEAGFTYVYENPAKLKPEERATLGRLRATVEDGIAQQQQDPKVRRQLTYDEKKTVMQGVLRQTVMIDKSFRYDLPAIASVVSPGDRGKAYVPLAEIPTQNQKDAANYLRSTNPAFSRLNDAAILARASRAIERAYAAKLLGLGADEERRRLTEAQ